jgi:hypothetical protein
MRTLVIVSLILMFVVVIGVTIRGTVFRKYLPEGFENAANATNTEGENAAAAATVSTEGENAATTANTEGEKKGEKKESDTAVQVDTASGMKDFMAELGDNKGAMNHISQDTQAMIQNQKELMDMMKSVQPALTQGMEFMKAFKGMMGNN